MFRSELIPSDKDHPGGAKWRVNTADHFSDVLDFIDRERTQWTSGFLASQAEHGEPYKDDENYKLGLTDRWAGTKTVAEAIELSRRGWDQGLKLLADSLDASNIIQKQSRVMAEGLDVAGTMPFIPSAVAGDPLCMVSAGLDRAKTKPIFRIMISGSVSAGVSMQTVIHRGAAVLSWVDKLEGAGYQCEILYIHSCSGPGSVNKFTNGFPIKGAGEPLNIDRAAFMLAHPAMLRRIVFAIYERFKDIEPGFRFGYGMPVDYIPPQLETDHSIYFPCLHASRGDWKNPASAITAVERAILKGLTQDRVDEDLKEQMNWEAA
jgi:hypothetical protein